MAPRALHTRLFGVSTAIRQLPHAILTLAMTIPTLPIANRLLAMAIPALPIANRLLAMAIPIRGDNAEDVDRGGDAAVGVMAPRRRSPC